MKHRLMSAECRLVPPSPVSGEDDEEEDKIRRSIHEDDSQESPKTAKQKGDQDASGAAATWGLLLV